MPELFAQGLELLVYGMGTVVLFLGLLVVATRLMSRLVLAFFPDPEPLVSATSAGSAQQPVSQPSAPAFVPASGDPSSELLAVITAAVHLHRQRNSQPE
jgi:oxaloacetate decarboxylase gamma subunit